MGGSITNQFLCLPWWQVVSAEVKDDIILAVHSPPEEPELTTNSCVKPWHECLDYKMHTKCRDVLLQNVANELNKL